MNIGQIIKVKEPFIDGERGEHKKRIVGYQIIQIYPHCVLLHKIVRGKPDPRIRWCPGIRELFELVKEEVA